MNSKFLTIVIFQLIVFGLKGQQSELYSEIKSHSEGTGLWWTGHNGWLIKSGDLLVSTDLALEYPRRIDPPPISTKEIAADLNISFITHGHNDHFNDSTSIYLTKYSKCIFVMPESCLPKARELNIPEDRIKIAVPRTPFEIKNIKVEPLRAIHGNANFSIYYDANMKDCGYVINIDGKKFLQPGDSYLLEDHLFLKDIDVLFFSPTEHNMYIDRSVILINTLDPDYIFPQHHSTIGVNESTRFWAKGYPDEVKLRLSQQMKQKYHILQIGDKIMIE